MNMRLVRNERFCISLHLPAPDQVFGVGVTHGIKVPVTLAGPDMSYDEHVALGLKIHQGTQAAARYLRNIGWAVEEALDLLCVRGALCKQA